MKTNESGLIQPYYGIFIAKSSWYVNITGKDDGPNRPWGGTSLWRTCTHSRHQQIDGCMMKLKVRKILDTTRSTGRAWRAACAVNLILDYPDKPGNDREERPGDGRGMQDA
ncbi:MAG: hypothetical protein ACOC03_05160 [Desulfosalsimonas sp.]